MCGRARGGGERLEVCGRARGLWAASFECRGDLVAVE